MATSKDPLAVLHDTAAAFPDVVVGTSCNQTSYKAGKTAFLYLGPGAKDVGYKAMFKLDASLGQAGGLAAAQPDRFEVGKQGWVTARFSAEKPLAKAVWSKWLKESYGLTRAGKR